MTVLRDIAIAEVEANTLPYRNALYHRSTLVEGIRKIAARNMVHLSRARGECGYGGDTSTLPDGWIEDVQNRMLLDQDLEPSRANRAFMGYATFLPVQIYLCLLHAGIEFYTKMAGQSFVCE